MASDLPTADDLRKTSQHGIALAPRIGRPSTYTDEIALAICDRIAHGDSLRQIDSDDTMPSKATIMRWLTERPAFQDQYALARQAQMEHYADEIMDISDDGRNDWMERQGKEDAGWVANGENIQRSRLRVDTRKWLMSKLYPKVYGDNKHMTVDVMHKSPLDELTDEQLHALARRKGAIDTTATPVSDAAGTIEAVTDGESMQDQ